MALPVKYFFLFPFLVTFRVNFLTLNVRGFGNDTKQRTILDFAWNSRADFIFLQETLVADPGVFDSLRSKWAGQSFWSPTNGKQGGTALLVSENSRFTVSRRQRDFMGRVVSVLASLDDLRLNLINIYAPTNPAERKGFFDTLTDYFFPTPFRIVAGDSNGYESAHDKFGGNFNPSSELQEFRATHNLVDIWRISHRGQTQCTWFNSDKSIGSRLDKFFVASEFSPHSAIEISACVFSDHDSVSLSVDLDNVPTHGPGIWRLNLDLLSDEEFCNLITQLIQKLLPYQHAFPSLHEWWDFLKNEIKITAIFFSRDKQRRLNHAKIRALNRLTDTKQALVNGDTSVKDLIVVLENELRAINEGHQKSYQIRSRAQWLEEGEKPSRFFLKLQSTSAKKNTMSAIFTQSGYEVTSQTDLEQAHFEFYQNLYSNSNTDLTAHKALLDNLHVSLDDLQRSLCEGPLTLAEISKAMHAMAKNKTPGSDGLLKNFMFNFGIYSDLS